MSNAEIQTQVKRPAFSAMISTPTYQKLIQKTITDPKRASRFVSSITSAVAVNPALQECDFQTIVSGALLGESLNLSPSPQLGQFYLVPFENRKRGCKEAQFILSYRGMIQLALRSGQYKRLNVLPVKEGELISWNPLTEEIQLDLIENDNVRDSTATIGYIASFEYLNGFTKTIYWSKEKMISHADRCSPAFSRNESTVKTKRGPVKKVSFADYEAKNYPADDEWMYSSYWYKDFDGMAMKTMLRQLISKWGIMSIEIQTAFDGDESVVLENGDLSHVEEEKNIFDPDTGNDTPNDPKSLVSLSDIQ